LIVPTVIDVVDAPNLLVKSRPANPPPTGVISTCAEAADEKNLMMLSATAPVPAVMVKNPTVSLNELNGE
jgi:hypothetical protein